MAIWILKSIRYLSFFWGGEGAGSIVLKSEHLQQSIIIHRNPRSVDVTGFQAIDPCWVTAHTSSIHYWSCNHLAVLLNNGPNISHCSVVFRHSVHALQRYHMSQDQHTLYWSKNEFGRTGDFSLIWQWFKVLAESLITVNILWKRYT